MDLRTDVDNNTETTKSTEDKEGPDLKTVTEDNVYKTTVATTFKYSKSTGVPFQPKHGPKPNKGNLAGKTAFIFDYGSECLFLIE